MSKQASLLGGLRKLAAENEFVHYIPQGLVRQIKQQGLKGIGQLYRDDPHRSPLEESYGEIMNVIPPDTTLTPAGIMTTPADTTYTHGFIPAAPRAYNWVGGGEEAWNPSLFEAMSLLHDNGRLRSFEGMYDLWRNLYGEPEALLPFPGNLPPLFKEGR